jgi:hypothetical protein
MRNQQALFMTFLFSLFAAACGFGVDEPDTYIIMPQAGRPATGGHASDGGAGAPATGGAENAGGGADTGGRTSTGGHASDGGAGAPATGGAENAGGGLVEACPERRQPNPVQVESAWTFSLAKDYLSGYEDADAYVVGAYPYLNGWFASEGGGLLMQDDGARWVVDVGPASDGVYEFTYAALDRGRDIWASYGKPEWEIVCRPSEWIYCRADWSEREDMYKVRTCGLRVEVDRGEFIPAGGVKLLPHAEAPDSQAIAEWTWGQWWRHYEATLDRRVLD